MEELPPPELPVLGPQDLLVPRVEPEEMAPPVRQEQQVLPQEPEVGAVGEALRIPINQVGTGQMDK
jgi:hypothetical protein